MNKEETEKIEEYLVEIAGCLFDVRMALDGARVGAGMEKGNLIRVGRDFGYQQGILDVCDELAKYASGELNLQEAVEELLKANEKMMEEQAQTAVSSGMEVG